MSLKIYHIIYSLESILFISKWDLKWLVRFALSSTKTTNKLPLLQFVNASTIYVSLVLLAGPKPSYKTSCNPLSLCTSAQDHLQQEEKRNVKKFQFATYISFFKVTWTQKKLTRIKTAIKIYSSVLMKSESYFLKITLWLLQMSDLARIQSAATPAQY